MFFTLFDIYINDAIFAVALQIVRLTCFLIFAKYFKNHYMVYPFKNKRTMVALLGPSILQMLIFELYFDYASFSYNLLMIASILTSVSLFYIINQEIKLNIELINNKVNQYSLSLIKNQLSEIMRSEKKIKGIRHDLKNHLIIINQLNATNNKEELKSYINDLEVLLEKDKSLIYCENIYINALLNYKIEENPKINFNLDLDFEGWNFIKEVDICIIISNLLDNAIREINSHSNLEKDIQLIVKNKGSFKILILKNSLSMTKDLYTDKEDIQNHGLGLSIVQNIVDKYKGTMICEQASEFIVKIVFQDNIAL